MWADRVNGMDKKIKLMIMKETLRTLYKTSQWGNEEQYAAGQKLFKEYLAMKDEK